MKASEVQRGDYGSHPHDGSQYVVRAFVDMRGDGLVCHEIFPLTPGGTDKPIYWLPDEEVDVQRPTTAPELDRLFAGIFESPAVEPAPLPLQTCAHCFKSKPRNDFNLNRASSDGLQSWCRECGIEYQRERSGSVKPTVEEKACSNCNKIKPAAEFNPDPKNSTGLRSWCKECGRKNSAERRANSTSKPQRGKRRASMEKWLLDGLLHGYLTTEEAQMITGKS